MDDSVDNEADDVVDDEAGDEAAAPPAVGNRRKAWVGCTEVAVRPSVVAVAVADTAVYPGRHWTSEAFCNKTDIKSFH